MMIGKASYLKEITKGVPWKSVSLGTSLEGISPPSVFIGSHHYPAVSAGPMIAPLGGVQGGYDAEETWIPSGLTQQEIIDLRLSLVRGTYPVDARRPEGRFISQLQDIALSDGPVGSRAEFRTAPRGVSFFQDSTPHGPSAPLTRLFLENPGWNRDLERTFHDTDLSARDAVMELHAKGMPFSRIQKAVSAGTLGKGKKRRLVPTRWSITATDTIIGDTLLEEVREYPVIPDTRLYRFSSLYNQYAIVLVPTPWQYEWAEAFVHVKGCEELVFADHEGLKGKIGYSTVGGCFYSCRMAILEYLAREQVQAGAIVLREATRGYIPLGVFNVRENVRNALMVPATEPGGLRDALSEATGTMTLPLTRFLSTCPLTRELLSGGQTTLGRFC